MQDWLLEELLELGRYKRVETQPSCARCCCLGLESEVEVEAAVLGLLPESVGEVERVEFVERRWLGCKRSLLTLESPVRLLLRFGNDL